MLANLRLTISMGIDAIPAMTISKRYMDIVMTRKPGIKMCTFRLVYVTKHQDAEKRCERKPSCTVLEQR
jgi:hypothetical protein